MTNDDLTKKPVPNWPGYHVTSDGRVFSEKTNRFLSGKLQRGYRRVHLIRNGHRQWIAVHRLVAEAFVPGRSEERWSVNHIDGNGLNNHHTNLEWASNAEQQDHATRTGLKPNGHRVGGSKLTTDTVLELFQRLEAGERQVDLAKEYGITQPQVSAIKTGRSWSHTTGKKLEAGTRTSKHHPRSVLRSVIGEDIEDWKPIDNAPGYWVSSHGRVFSGKTGRLLQTSRPNHNCYVAVNVRTPNGLKKKLVHRLVAEAFVPGKSPENWSVNHLDCNGMNNFYKNLEWASDTRQQAHKHEVLGR